MAGEWQVATIGDLADIESGKGLPKSKYSDGGRFPIMGSNGLLGWCDYPLYQHPVITIGRVGACGEIHKTDGPAWVSDNALVTMPKEDCDFRFLFYLLKSTDFSPIIGGTTQPLITQTAVKRLEVHVPPLKEQQAIACILGALDDKIELNRRMNRTLEAIARALFKSWFVDFDPVRAKAERRGTGLSQPLAALFPDSFEDSELGEIPRGWRVGIIGDMADVFSGKRPDVRFPKASADANVPLWGGNGPMAFVSKPLIDYPIILTGRVGTLGSIFRITSPCWPSDNTLILRLKTGQAFEYLFLQLRRIDFVSLNRGSTQPLLTQTDLKMQKLLLLPSGLLEYFHHITKSLFLRLDSADDESRNLAALRDALLPKLISGEIRIMDAERFVDGVDKVDIREGGHHV